jgi:Domain of unknown function (DUF4062)
VNLFLSEHIVTQYLTPLRKVFISSTYNDLQEERQAAVEVILAAGHINGGMGGVFLGEIICLMKRSLMAKM